MAHGGPPPLPPRPRSRARGGRATADRDRSERADANRKLWKAWRFLQGLRPVYWSLAVVSAVLPIAFWVTLVPEDRMPRSTAQVLSLVLGGAAILFVVGAIRLGREPLLWSGLAAVLSMVAVVFAQNIFTMLLAAGCCGAFVAVYPAASLLKKYPDLPVSRHILGEDADVDG